MFGEVYVSWGVATTQRHYVNNVLFEQYGATCHIVRETLVLLDNFPGTAILQNHDVKWTPGWYDFFQRGYLKSQV